MLNELTGAHGRLVAIVRHRQPHRSPRFRHKGGVVPQCLDFHGLAARGVKIVSHVGVHPGQQTWSGALATSSPSAGVDMDIEMRSRGSGTAMMSTTMSAKRSSNQCLGQPEDGRRAMRWHGSTRALHRQSSTILRVSLQEKDSAGGQIADVVGECHQCRSRLGEATRRQHETFEGNHRVAAPIQEPIVASDHRPQTVALPDSVDRFLWSALWKNEELVGCHHQSRQERNTLRLGDINQFDGTGSFRRKRFPCILRYSSQPSVVATNVTGHPVRSSVSK